jgi:hypothetical protein
LVTSGHLRDCENSNYVIVAVCMYLSGEGGISYLYAPEIPGASKSEKVDMCPAGSQLPTHSTWRFSTGRQGVLTFD